MSKNKNLQPQIEAILFSSGEPVEIPKLAGFFKVSKKELSEILDKMANFYHSEKSGLQLVFQKNTVQLASRSDFGETVSKFLGKELNEPLSKSLWEVLAIIAYRGPMTRAQVDYIRGVNSAFAIRNLALRGLLERRENPADSRSYLYEASGEFLKGAGLGKISDLPNYAELSQPAKDDSESKSGLKPEKSGIS